MKNILSVENEEPVITEDDLKLINFLREEYLCKYIDAIRLLIPVGILKGAKSKSRNVIVFIDDNLEKIKNKDGYIETIDFIKKNTGKYTKTELSKEHGLSIYKLNKLMEHGLIKSEEEIVFRYNTREYNKDVQKNLTAEQSMAIKEIEESEENLILLKGVTGSGKTEVYMEMIAKVLSEGRQAIVLIPEIALTYQTVMRFYTRFGERVSILNSRMSQGERYDQMERVKKGEVDIMIGPRSALFTPFEKLGLIVIDEEHEPTYKSEQVPRFHARETAIERARMEGASVVLGSATPSLEAFYACECGRYQMLRLKMRTGKQELPQVYVADMREELKHGNRSILSDRLEELMQDRLDKKEQMMLFLNRRGYAGFVSCRACGYVVKCPHCDVSLSVHRGGKMVCHYCGYETQTVQNCPSCGSAYIGGFRAGTQQIEEIVKRKFPQARVLRMDMDTTKNKGGHEKILSKFADEEADIMIGTQMIVKGHDFPNVTLVGVLAADMRQGVQDGEDVPGKW